MRKRMIGCLGVYLLITQMLFSNVLACRASEIGSGAYPMPDNAETRQPVAAITSVSVSPVSTVVSKGASYGFVASVAGQNDYSREVAWSVQGQMSQNTYIDGSGILHVGSDETSSSLTVKAVSQQDSGYSATALVTVQTSSYSIQVKASPDNGGTVYGGGVVKEGGSAVLTATPNSGFAFEGWFINNNKVSGNTQYTVENIHSDGVYVADFRPANCQVNISVNDSNAGTATEGRTVKYGESMTLEAVAKSGYRFDGWMENGTTVSKDSRWQLDNITGSRNLTAVFSRIQYTLTLNGWPASTGTVSGQGTYDEGSDIKIKAVPASGYRFVSWSENSNVISKDPEYFVNGLSRDMFLVATFERDQKNTYFITASVSSSNGKIVPEGKSSISEGSGMSYVIMPQEGYIVNAVYVDGRSVGAVSSYSFSDVRGNHSISADFVPKPGENFSSQAQEDKSNGKDGINKTDEDDQPDQNGKDTQGEDTEEVTGTLRSLAISAQEAEQLIEADNDMELMDGAIGTGDLQVIIYNDFADTKQATSHGGFDENLSVKNLEVIWDRVLTKEEKMEMLQGKVPIIINFSVDDTDGEESQETVEAFAQNKLPGMTIGRYFEVRLTKAGQDDAQAIQELPETVKVLINVPKHLQADNREFYILRLHTKEDGSQDFAQLLDEDDRADTITFSTDRFSPYAIAYIDWPSEDADITESAENTAGEKGLASVVGIMAVAIAVVITVWLLWYIIRKKKH